MKVRHWSNVEEEKIILLRLFDNACGGVNLFVVEPSGERKSFSKILEITKDGYLELTPNIAENSFLCLDKEGYIRLKPCVCVDSSLSLDEYGRVRCVKGKPLDGE